ncbi:CinA family protein [Pedobacter sp. SYSU D00535]|uniref:CinA family protein n=1 Tax=Pedobacter sp. SYSU D00535 TaxID=2810308 RepID=UPI001A9783B4|nr:CinA family protein [Pedobacter sp. SYSU D00535]
MPSRSVIACAHNLLAKNLTIAFAESASTGKLVYDFTSVPNCGTVVKGSIVCYDRSVKEQLLGIPGEIIDKYTAESAEVTSLLAQATKKLIPADVVVAVTGLASEGGSESEEKPVGTMFVHGIIKDEEWKAQFLFDGTPDEIVAQTIDAIATVLLEKISNIP